MTSKNQSILSLSDLKTGEHAIFQEIHAQRGVVCRLSSLGFTPGVELKMNQNYGFGPLVVSLRGTRVALGRQEAKETRVCRSES
jgi:ferrous iron transport protein A